MKGFRFGRAALKWPIRALLGCIAALILFAIACLIDANFLRSVIARYASSRTGRAIQIGGNLTAHLFALSPRLTAERVSIGNPPWMPPGPTADVGTLSLSIELLPLFSGSFVLDRLVADNASLHLVRAVDGRANWQAHPPGTRASKGLPPMSFLSLPNARVELHDDRRHLDFAGTVSAGETQGNGNRLPFQIKGAGQLNGKAVSFTIGSESLATMRPRQPYHFEFEEQSSGSRLTGHGVLTQPLDVRYLSTTFEAQGEDLKDLYYLIGVTFPDTGNYRLSGKLERQGLQFKYTDLVATSGQSDMHGTLSVDSTSGRSHFESSLYSERLRTSDLGATAAGRGAPRSERHFLLPDKPLRLAGIRHGDGAISYTARELDVGRVVMHSVSARVSTNHAVLEVPSLVATFPDGKVSGHLKFDATFEVPKAELDMHVTDLQLGQFDPKGTKPPPIEGLLEARLLLSGRGRSIHELAETSSGTMSAVLPGGAIRASLAELTGIDVTKALGLTLRVRCAVASFQVHNGTVASQELVIDTEPVRISGKGEIHMDSEALDFTLSGKPKSSRLVRVRAPVLIQGTLEHPKMVEPGKSLIRVGAAVALGELATPFAAILAFVDPGLAKNADCAGLISEAKSASAASSAAPASESASVTSK
jgi:AsmA family protein